MSTLSDLSLLTTLPENILNKIFDVLECYICDAIQEAKLNNNSIVEIDLVKFKLVIKLSPDDIRYKIIPSKSLETSIISTLKSNQNTLQTKLEKSFIKKLNNTYKDLF